jgi:hypothetical protein
MRACAQAYRCVNRSTEIAPEDEKRLMIQCITKYVSHTTKLKLKRKCKLKRKRECKMRGC